MHYSTHTHMFSITVRFIEKNIITKYIVVTVGRVFVFVQIAKNALLFSCNFYRVCIQVHSHKTSSFVYGLSCGEKYRKWSRSLWYIVE